METKPNLQLVKSSTLRLGGLKPGPEMKPGEYVAVCETAWCDEAKEKKPLRVVWQFHIVEGEHAGVSLRKWLFPADKSNHVSPSGDYARSFEIALGRPIRKTDDLEDPGPVFSGKVFRVFVGYRKTIKPRGGAYSDNNTLIRKDDKDSLRVHYIQALVKL